MARTAASATEFELGLPRTDETSCSSTRLGVIRNEPIASTAATRTSSGAFRLERTFPAAPIASVPRGGGHRNSLPPRLGVCESLLDRRQHPSVAPVPDSTRREPPRRIAKSSAVHGVVRLLRHVGDELGGLGLVEAFEDVVGRLLKPRNSQIGHDLLEYRQDLAPCSRQASPRYLLTAVAGSSGVPVSMYASLRSTGK